MKKHKLDDALKYARITVTIHNNNASVDPLLLARSKYLQLMASHDSTTYTIHISNLSPQGMRDISDLLNEVKPDWLEGIDPIE